jgi:hypothetical protein
MKGRMALGTQARAVPEAHPSQAQYSVGQCVRASVRVRACVRVYVCTRGIMHACMHALAPVRGQRRKPKVLFNGVCAPRMRA